MARFERSKEKKSRKGSRDDSPKRERKFEDYKPSKKSRRSSKESRDSGRGFNRGRRDSKGRKDFGRSFNRGGPRRELEMTKVTCSACGKECEVPFKPSSDKPVYCRDCFSKTDDRLGNVTNKMSNHDLDIINEKLNKIMKALEIE